jgi:hypothetical protein
VGAIGTAVRAAMRDVRRVVHLAGSLGDYDLETLFRVNAHERRVRIIGLPATRAARW